jgi:hypothetical protein
MPMTPFEKILKAEEKKEKRRIQEGKSLKAQKNWQKMVRAAIEAVQNAGGVNIISGRLEKTEVKNNQPHLAEVPAAVPKTAIIIAFPRRKPDGIICWGSDAVRRPHRRRKVR